MGIIPTTGDGNIPFVESLILGSNVDTRTQEPLETYTCKQYRSAHNTRTHKNTLHKHNTCTHAHQHTHTNAHTNILNRTDFFPELSIQNKVTFPSLPPSNFKGSSHDKNSNRSRGESRIFERGGGVQEGVQL